MSITEPLKQESTCTWMESRQRWPTTYTPQSPNRTSVSSFPQSPPLAVTPPLSALTFPPFVVPFFFGFEGILAGTAHSLLDKSPLGQLRYSPPPSPPRAAATPDRLLSGASLCETSCPRPRPLCAFARPFEKAFSRVVTSAGRCQNWK